MRQGVFTTAVAAFFLASVLAGAQTRAPVVRVETFAGDALPQAELKTFERLVVSYIGELRTFRVIDAAGQELAIREAEAAVLMGTDAVIEPLTADFILTGSVGKVADLYTLVLEITRVSSGETRVKSETGRGVNDLVVKARELTYSLFDRQLSGGAATPSTPSTPAAPQAAASPGTMTARKTPTLAMVEGQWTGDKGIDRIRIFKNGTGLAFLSNRVTMKIRILVEGDSVIIVQDQPNSPSFYQAVGVSFEIARKAAAQARPMRWILSLDETGAVLFGRKETITIAVTGGQVSVDNSFVREAILRRSPK